MCTRLLDLRMKAPSQSVLPRIDKEADDGRFTSAVAASSRCKPSTSTKRAPPPY